MPISMVMPNARTASAPLTTSSPNDSNVVSVANRIDSMVTD